MHCSYLCVVRWYPLAARECGRVRKLADREMGHSAGGAVNQSAAVPCGPTNSMVAIVYSAS